jgi:Bacterial archaeo-eukaryotic release factor family 10
VSLDRRLLLELSNLRDPLGVLSVYVDAGSNELDASRIVVRNALSELVERSRSEGVREPRIALSRRIEALEPLLAELTSVSTPGRGRALFAPLGSDETRRIALQLPFPTRVVLDESAFVRPLVAALEAGRPTGLVVVSHAGVRVFEWSFGDVEELAHFRIEQDTDNWKMMRGPAPSGSWFAQESASQEDRFRRRLAQKQAELAAELGVQVDQLSREHGWEHILVAGDDRLTGPLLSRLPAGEPAQTARTSLIAGEWLSAEEIADMLLPDLERARRGNVGTLIERARDAALSGGRGAVGLQDVLAALHEGRVDTLLYDEARELRGLRASDGRLFPEGIDPGIPEAELSAEPYLVERMIERALETDADVTPVEGEEAARLAEHEGVAALLRW